MTKSIKLITATVLSVALSSAFADVIPINPDGPNPADGVLQVGSLDWNVGNGLAVADAGQTLGAGGRFVGQQFTFYGHSTLSGFNNAVGTSIAGTGLNSAYEWTYVTGFREQIVQSGANLTFTTVGGAANPTTNFFQIYYDPLRDANPLTGLGFNNGTLILSGHILAGPSDGIFSNSNFSISDPNAAVPLDAFNANNYPNILTIRGQGGGSLSVAVDFADLAFFPNGLSILQQDFTTSQTLAFNQQDPSACFYTGAGFVGGAGGGACLNTIGTQNGVNGPNLQLQTDANSSFIVNRVPEPASLGLVGLALLGLGIGRRRQAKSQG